MLESNKAISLRDILAILLGIGLLCLILLPGLVGKTEKDSSINVEMGKEKPITPGVENRNKPDYELFVCLGVYNGTPVEPKTVFSATDKIHCLIRWQGISKGNHEVEYYWINPKEETQEYYKQDFLIGREDRYNTWSWLRLRESEFTISTEFIGRWSVQVFFDGEFITEENFRVN